MGNENQKDEQVSPYKKSNDIVISKILLRNIILGLLVVFCGFLVLTYFDCGLTHRKVKQVFLEKYWGREEKMLDFNVDGVKQIKKDTYWVKVRYRILENEWVDEKGDVKKINYKKGSNRFWDYLIEEDGLKELFNCHEYKEDLLYIKWDTGWFVEKKKK